MTQKSMKFKLVESELGGVFQGHFPFEEDTSLSKHRYLLVWEVADASDNKVLCVKCTTNDGRGYDDYCVVVDKWLEAGFTEPTVVRCSKLAILDVDQDITDFKGELELPDLIKVKAQINLYLNDTKLTQRWEQCSPADKKTWSRAAVHGCFLSAQRLSNTTYGEDQKNLIYMCHELSAVLRMNNHPKL